MSVEFTVTNVRELKGAALSIVCLLSLVTMPVTQEWLERNSGYSDKPISQALAYLQETGRVVKTSRGWHLAGGTQLMLGAQPDGDDASRKNSDSGKDEENASRKNSDPNPEIVDLQAENGSLSRNNSDSEPENPGSIMMIDDESLNSNKLIHHQSEPENSGKIPTLEILLAAIPVLQGKRGSSSEPWETLDPCDLPDGTSSRQLLAWIVKSYQDRNRLSNPLGVILARLRAKSVRSLPGDWQERLPADFLVKIGVAVPALVPELPRDDDSDDIQDDPEPESELQTIWIRAVGCLELPRSIQERVDDTTPLEWDARSGILTVAAKDQDACEWLDSRLRSSVSRVLCGILDCQADVTFVVGGE